MYVEPFQLDDSGIIPHKPRHTALDLEELLSDPPVYLNDTTDDNDSVYDPDNDLEDSLTNPIENEIKWNTEPYSDYTDATEDDSCGFELEEPTEPRDSHYDSLWRNVPTDNNVSTAIYSEDSYNDYTFDDGVPL